MRQQLPRWLLLCFTAMFGHLSGCTTLSSKVSEPATPGTGTPSQQDNGTPVVVDQPATFQIGTKAPRDVPAGEIIYLNEPARVTAPGFYPLFVVPEAGNASKISLSLVPLSVEELEKRAKRSDIDQLLGDVLKIQELLIQKKLADAVASVDELKKTWGELVFLDYLKASAFLLDRNYDQALGVVQSALQRSPDNDQLKSLESAIQGQLHR